MKQTKMNFYKRFTLFILTLLLIFTFFYITKRLLGNNYKYEGVTLDNEYVKLKNAFRDYGQLIGVTEDDRYIKLKEVKRVEE